MVSLEMTRYLPILLLAACSAASVNHASKAPDAGIVDLTAEISDAWNAHSPEAMAALFVEGGTLVVFLSVLI